MTSVDIFILRNELRLRKVRIKAKILKNNPNISFEKLNEKITDAQKSFCAPRLIEFIDKNLPVERLGKVSRFY